MNGVPITALSIVGFPSDKLSHEVLAEILRGSQKVAEEAEISISGGFYSLSSIPTQQFPQFYLIIETLKKKVTQLKIWNQNSVLL